MIPYQFGDSYDEQRRAGATLINPHESTDENLIRGKEQFEIFCAMCHGLKGAGDGHLFINKLFNAKPTALNDNYIGSKPDGEIYHIITKGSLSKLMGAHGSQVAPDDRWKIILYIRNNFKDKK